VGWYWKAARRRVLPPDHRKIGFDRTFLELRRGMSKGLTMAVAILEKAALGVTDDVQSWAQAALRKSPIYPLRDLKVVLVGRKLVISGRVKTFYQKQLAQEVVRNAEANLQVVNEVRVG
jgi:osmotically-inducible protein OsmY